MADQPAGSRRFHQRSAADLRRAPCIEDEAEVHAAFWYKLCRQQGLAECFLQAGKKTAADRRHCPCVGIYAICQGVQHSLSSGVIDGERDEHLLDQPPGGDIVEPQAI